MAYSKLHSSIVASSLWSQSDSVRLLFITLLAMCDKDGVVYGSRSGITRLSMIDPDDEEHAWNVLLSPDPESSDQERAPENEGRRIEKVSGGYKLLNFAYYRGLRNDDDRREQNRQAQARFKAKGKTQPAKAEVSHGKPAKAEGETESASRAGAEAETKAETKAETDPLPESLRDERFRKAWADWLSNRKQAKLKPYTELGAKTQLGKLAEIGVNRSISAIYHSIANQYQGIYEPKENQNANATRNPPLSPSNNNLNRNAVESYSQIRQKLSVDVHPGGNGNGAGAANPE